MAALWSLEDVDVYVNRLERQKDSIWAEIDILGATATELHWYGAKSLRVRASGTLWGRDDIDTLEGYADASTTLTLAGPNSLSWSVKLVTITSRRIPDKKDVTNECFGVEMELIKV